MAKTTKPASAEPKPKPAPTQEVASGHHRFFVGNGHVLTQLSDIALELGSIDEATFSHHVNKEKNDFAQWVQDVLHDKVLAGKLRKAGTRAEALAVLQAKK